MDVLTGVTMNAAILNKDGCDVGGSVVNERGGKCVADADSHHGDVGIKEIRLILVRSGGPNIR